MFGPESKFRKESEESEKSRLDVLKERAQGIGKFFKKAKGLWGVIAGTLDPEKNKGTFDFNFISALSEIFSNGEPENKKSDKDPTKPKGKK